MFVNCLVFQGKHITNGTIKIMDFLNQINMLVPKYIHNTKLTPKVKNIIHENKIKYNYGPLKMKIFVKRNYDIDISTTTIYKFYKKKHLIRKPQKKQKWYTPLKEPYVAVLPGENVQLDVKYVPGRNMTWAYQFRLIDTVTNLQFSVDMDNKKAKTTINVFKQAQKYFQFQIIGIQTDNGSEFRGDFHKYLVRKEIVHRYIPKKISPMERKKWSEQTGLLTMNII